ncbi:hypothetical protein GTQ48_11070 [Alteromonas genovensis]|uniref:Uncharacterized protein n=1 Tax=Alteromonas genovensis TaxID=471225 RepID=A0A6N9TFV9_9ALTE|nr:FlgO family outer membrane protein [Alteromonas genovensis]NDW16060.1 hypothetical protein [Alteromonas genovensis]
MKIFSEFKRRNVFKVASVYLVTCWIILQIVAVISPALHLPTLFSTIITVILVIAFPFVCIFAWAFELTPEGLKRTHEVDINESIGKHTGNKINYLLAISLTFALGFIFYQNWFIDSADDSVELSIAVLPFEDMSPDSSQSYFGDGIAEEILNSLARLNKLVVIARTSSFNFKDSNNDIREIGKKLNVNYVLEGSVRKDKNQLRITAQLIEVSSGAHIWSQTYDRTLDSIFAVQDELTYAITQALKLNLLPEQVEQEAGMTKNPKAYELFIKGREFSYQRSSESLQQAADFLKQATKQDPQFHLAKAQLYMVYELASYYGGFNTEESQAENERLFWELTTAPDFPLKTLVTAIQAEKNYRLEVTKQLHQMAYNQSPNDPLIQNISTLYLDDFQEMIKRREQILRTNPQSQINASNLMYLYLIAEQPQRAEQLLSTINTNFKDSSAKFIANFYYYYAYKQDIQKTLELINTYRGEPNSEYRRVKSSIYILSGNVNIALAYMNDELSQLPDGSEDFFNAYLLLLDLETKGKLTEQQQVRYRQLPVTEEFQNRVLAYYKLEQGDEALYEKQQQLAGATADEFFQQVDLSQLEPYSYAAIKKFKGDDSYARKLRGAIDPAVSVCQQTQNKNSWSCAGYLYLVKDVLKTSVKSMFNRQPLLDDDSIGSETFLLTSPRFYGLNQHPDFKPLATSFINSTFGKWNPDLAIDEITVSNPQ